MPVYKFTVEVANSTVFARCIRLIMKWGKLRSTELLDDAEPSQEEPLPSRKLYAQKDEDFYQSRNEEIIAKYTADTKANSSEKLAQEYGISRERVCQILRKVNAIGTAQARRDAAREALTETRQKLKEETKAAWEAKIAEALELVQQGKSIRQAAMAVGLEPHSNLVNLIGKRAHLAGIKILHGWHGDFSERKANVRALSAEGFSVPQIVAKLRNSTDPHIYEAWIYNHTPEVKSKPRS